MGYSRGFTAVELMVTIVIVSVMATFSYPYFQNMKFSINGQCVTNEMFSALQLAKLRAIKENRFVVVQLYKHGYLIFLDDGRGGGNPGDWKHHPDEIVLFDENVTTTMSMSTHGGSTESPRGEYKRFRFRGVYGMQPRTITIKSMTNRLETQQIKTYKIKINRLGRLRQER